MMTREEILAIYKSGPEAMIALVETLFLQIEQLTARVKELEGQLAKDSHNSSRPPSSDGLKAKPKSLRRPSGKKPGGQTSHQGHTLQMVETPKRIVTHSPEKCTACGADLRGTVAKCYERRQVFDLPKIELEVTEHRAENKCCPNCQALTKGQFPPLVTNSVQYGPQVKALGIYFLQYNLLPYERTCKLFEDVFGCNLSEATLQDAVTTCADNLVETEQHIKDGVTQAAVTDFDETGMRILKKCHWLHVASTPDLTYYATHPKRGKVAMDAIEILPRFKGTAVHDGWNSYYHYGCKHGLCNAHHLRELIFLEEQEEQPWATGMKRLLLNIKEQVDRKKREGAADLPEELERQFVAQYHQILQQGLQANPPPHSVIFDKRGRKKQSKAKNLLDRLQAHWQAVLAFMYDFRVPFDNNLAERDLRMMKVRQKVSGCFRTLAGATRFCRIRGYLSTIRKQGHNILNAIFQAFIGSPIPIAIANR